MWRRKGPQTTNSEKEKQLRSSPCHIRHTAKLVCLFTNKNNLAYKQTDTTGTEYRTQKQTPLENLKISMLGLIWTVPIWAEGKVLENDGGDGCTTL